MSDYIRTGAAILAILLFAVILVNPLGFVPSMGLMVMTVGAIILVGVFLGLFWWESQGENGWRLFLIPDRAALFAGAGVLLIGLFLQSILETETIDPWIVAGLMTAIAAWILGDWYRKSKNK